MGRVLIIGAGGVGGVVAAKCAEVHEVFSEVVLASRTIEKCERIRSRIHRPIEIAEVDADDVHQLVDLVEEVSADLIVNAALPYQDLTIMEACLATGVDYLDTANYEPRDEAKFCYRWQWDYHSRFQERGIMALLGCGFDPGVTNAFCAHASKHVFDEIERIDILDCNGGVHRHPFATNFNPEINIREVTAPGRYYQDGRWIEVAPLSVSKTFDFPGIGVREVRLLYHEELESLAKNIPYVGRLRFWMSFSDEYLTHLRVLQNVGMTRIDPVVYEGREVVPLKFLKALLPDPAGLGEGYLGKTCIGCLIDGKIDGDAKRYFIYNICDHVGAYQEASAQAVHYTTGVPAMIGAMLISTGIWRREGVFNVEELDPDPFMELLPKFGLPWTEEFLD